jgi:Rrf2 family protein
VIDLKISTKGRYGLEAIVDLAIHEKEGPISIKSIAERCEISDAYIMQLFMVLKRANLIKSIRGAQGGYLLAKSPCDISVGDVLKALEGPLSPVDCILDDLAPCDRFEMCTTKDLWLQIMHALDHVVDHISLDDIMTCYHADQTENQNITYYI